MKKLLFLILSFVSVLSYGQQTDATTKSNTNTLIRNAPLGGVTRAIVSDMADALTDSKVNRSETLISSGTNDYTISPTWTPDYARNPQFKVKFVNGNTGAVTVNTIPVKKNVSTALSSGDIAAGAIYDIVYDGTNFQIILPGSGGGTTYSAGTGLTLTTTTFSVNTSQNISTLSNLTTNGYVKTGSGTGALSVSTAIPESDVTNLTSDLALKAPLASPTFTGTPSLPTGTIATTQSAGDNSTKLATTAYTDRIIADLSTPSTASGTITLDLNSQYSRRFIGSASFSSGKTMALSNSTNAFVFDFTFTITNVAATLTFPSGWGMADLNWVSSTGIWTPPSTGTYEMSGLYNGTNWNIKISSAFTYH